MNKTTGGVLVLESGDEAGTPIDTHSPVSETSEGKVSTELFFLMFIQFDVQVEGAQISRCVRADPTLHAGIWQGHRGGSGSGK